MKLYTSAAVARTLGLDEKEVKALTKAGVIKKGYTARGLYIIEDTAREIIANYKKPEHERENVDYNAERAKMVRAKRMNAEYDLRLREKELVEAREIKMVLDKIVSIFRARLLSIPARIAPQMAETRSSAEAADILKTVIREALEELADVNNVLNAEEEQDGDQQSGI